MSKQNKQNKQAAVTGATLVPVCQKLHCIEDEINNSLPAELRDRFMDALEQVYVELRALRTA
jgi:hypothetical protein